MVDRNLARPVVSCRLPSQRELRTTWRQPGVSVAATDNAGICIAIANNSRVGDAPHIRGVPRRAVRDLAPARLPTDRRRARRRGSAARRIEWQIGRLLGPPPGSGRRKVDPDQLSAVEDKTERSLFRLIGTLDLEWDSLEAWGKDRAQLVRAARARRAAQAGRQPSHAVTVRGLTGSRDIVSPMGDTSLGFGSFAGKARPAPGGVTRGDARDAENPAHFSRWPTAYRQRRASASSSILAERWRW
jgi:hypothetical protein